ncbi:MAG: CoA-binding protein [Pseudomonadales bacterium]|nr:CoA-binding protein [Pseudomonadales bacterium]
MTVNHSGYSDEYLASILKNVKTIALVGASAKPERASHEVMMYLQENGYRVIPVNPGLVGTELLGETVYGSMLDVPGDVDMVEVFRRSEKVAGVCDEALEIKTKVVWMQIGVTDIDAARRLEREGIKVVMDRCPKQDIPRLRSMGLL